MIRKSNRHVNNSSDTFLLRTEVTRQGTKEKLGIEGKIILKKNWVGL